MDSPLYIRLVNTKPRGLWFTRKNEDRRCVRCYKNGRRVFRIRRKCQKYKMVFSWQKRVCGFNILQPSRLQEGDTCSRHAGVLATEYRKRIAVARSSSRYQYLFQRSSYRKPTAEERCPIDEEYDSDEYDSDSTSHLRERLHMHIKKRVFLNFNRNQKKRKLAILPFPRLSVEQVIDHAKELDEELDRYGPLEVQHVFGYLMRKGVTLDKHYKSNHKCLKWEYKKRVFLKSWELRICDRIRGTDKVSREELKQFERWIIINYMAHGPVVGLVFCNESFDEDFHSKFGFKKYERFVQEDGHVAGHYIVIIGHGFCTWVGRKRGRKWLKKRCFFLVQDSSGMISGPSKNGLCIVFSRALDRVYAPSFCRASEE